MCVRVRVWVEEAEGGQGLVVVRLSEELLW
jgi:hypothetical protein